MFAHRRVLRLAAQHLGEPVESMEVCREVDRAHTVLLEVDGATRYFSLRIPAEQATRRSMFGTVKPHWPGIARALEAQP